MAEQTVAWVLHSLEPGEETEVVGHLPTCPTCRALIHEAESAAAGLGSAVDQTAPPAGLRDRILDAAGRTAQVERPGPAAGPPIDARSDDRRPDRPSAG